METTETLDIVENAPVHSELNPGFSQLLQVRTLLELRRQKISTEIEKATSSIEKEIEKLQLQMKDIVAPFIEKIEPIGTEISIITEQLAAEWKDNKKTQVMNGYVVRRRDLKSVEILDKAKLIEKLKGFGNLNDAIKNFDNKILKTLADAGVLKEVVELKVKHSISCSIDKTQVKEKPIGKLTEEPRIEGGDIVAPGIINPEG